MKPAECTTSSIERDQHDDRCIMQCHTIAAPHNDCCIVKKKRVPLPLRQLDLSKQHIGSCLEWQKWAAHYVADGDKGLAAYAKVIRSAQAMKIIMMTTKSFKNDLR